MIGTDLINKIKQLGEDKEIRVEVYGCCEGILCHMVQEIDYVGLCDNVIILNIDTE